MLCQYTQRQNRRYGWVRCAIALVAMCFLGMLWGCAEKTGKPQPEDRPSPSDNAVVESQQEGGEQDHGKDGAFKIEVDIGEGSIKARDDDTSETEPNVDVDVDADFDGQLKTPSSSNGGGG